MVAMCGFAGATAIAAHVRLPLPFSPVPVTLQTLVVLLAGAALGPWAGAGSQGMYLAAGAWGLPIFAGGPAALIGPTAGYLWAFPLAAWLVGFIWRERCRWSLAVGLLAGTAMIYLLGASWLAVMTGKSAGAAMMLGVAPFLPGDAMKLVAVWAVAKPTRRGYEVATSEPSGTDMT